MDKHALWKWLVLAGLAAWSLAVVWPPREKVRLGLDLRGGTSFTVEIDESELEKQLREQHPDLTHEEVRGRMGGAVRRAQEQSLEIIRNRVDALGIAEPMIYPEHNNRVVVQIPGLTDEDRDRARDLIESAAFLEFSMVHEDNDRLVSALFERGLAPEGYRMVSADRRHRTRFFYQRDREAVPDRALDEDFKESLERFQAPAGYRFMLKHETVEGQDLYVPYFVRRRYEMRGDSIRSAGIEYDQLGRPYVTLKFDAAGSRLFARITRDYAPGGPRNPSPDGMRFMAIILDGTLYSAPFIRTAIYGGEAVIEGDFTLREAQNLAIVLRAGSLPAPVSIIESRSVDPTLGRDSIESGVRASIYACIAVVVFMIGYYSLAGIVANVGLMFNIVLLPLAMMIAAGFLGMFAGEAVPAGRAMMLPVLTLPGIAGIVLTIGMAVDANILIFERIREEQGQGKRLGPAVEAGYHKAFVTILDSNITTIISAVILFVFGTGAVRGFGITLTAGIMASMYTALVVTRMIFNAIAGATSIASLKMLRLFGATSVDFVGLRKFAILSLIAIAGTWVVMIGRGVSDPGSVLGTDFTGGAAITYSFDRKPEAEDIRAVLDSAGITEARIQYQREMDRDDEYLMTRVGFEAGDTAKNALLAGFADYGLRVLSEDNVGPQIGAEMVRRALTALALALVGMVIYISIRFQFAFAIGAIAALAHDVLICVGIYVLFGRQINMPTIAALLAVIGFSVNDTIVIFDRVRENLSRHRNRTFLQVCNLSINETLNRTVLTSLTTLLAVGLLFVFGGGAINDFALVFVIGIVAGTYSTIFIATPAVAFLRSGKSGQTGATQP